MTTAADIHSEAEHGAHTGTWRLRVDLIGLGAVRIAGVGLGATILATRAPAPESTTAPGVPAVAPAAQAREQWYLDRSSEAPAVAETSAIATLTAIQAPDWRHR